MFVHPWGSGLGLTGGSVDYACECFFETNQKEMIITATAAGSNGIADFESFNIAVDETVRIQ